jgi:hypothetical protein
VAILHLDVNLSRGQRTGGGTDRPCNQEAEHRLRSIRTLDGLLGLCRVADSAQFSTMVTELADQAHVGTALTLQLAGGFVLTVATIWLIPLLEDAVGWRWAFAVLAIGPALGVLAMLRLKSLPDARRIAGGLG